MTSSADPSPVLLAESLAPVGSLAPVESLALVLAELAPVELDEPPPASSSAGIEPGRQASSTRANVGTARFTMLAAYREFA